MGRDRLIEAWRQEEVEPFAGWDFSHLEGRMIEEQPPWSYMDRAAELMQSASSVLDMGTGGGERLLELRAHWPHRVVVTEDYPPNVRLASERLEPLGVRVEEVSLTDDGALPFSNGEFDLALNRHSGFNAAEVARILAAGGTFLTQQVHGLWGQDLLTAFGSAPQWPEAVLANDVPRLTKVGLRVLTAEEWQGEFCFTDVGAIVYYFKAIPWLVSGFSVDTHLEPLLALQSQLERDGRLCFGAGKYLMEASKRGEHTSSVAVSGALVN